MGVCTHWKPSSWKKRCTDWAKQFRTRVIAPNVLVRVRKWATSRKYSNVCRLAATG